MSLPSDHLEAPPEPAGQELCLQCLEPNRPDTNFCCQCGAPLTSYAATGPFEMLFAQGHAYRRATANPRRPVILLGIWLIFTPVALISALIAFRTSLASLWDVGFAMFTLTLSAAIIGKTTWNFFAAEPSGSDESERETTSR